MPTKSTSPAVQSNGAQSTQPSRTTPSRTRAASAATQTSARSVPPFDDYPHLIIENVWPELDGGRWPVKRVVGDVLEVWADVYKEGHDLLRAWVLIRKASESDWQRVPMTLTENDRWVGRVPLVENARYVFTIEAHTDVFGSWQADLRKRLDAHQDVASDLLEGQRIARSAVERAASSPEDHAAIQQLLTRWESADPADAAQLALSPELSDLVERHPDTSDATRYRNDLEVIADRERARFGAWYEFFPRSQGTDPMRGATFREAEARLPAIHDMGFDVVYMPPIHPIGRTNRKGPNNALLAGPNDPGSPYAIGAEAGGHEAIAPELGTLDDFLHFQQAAHDLGMELAMDFAIQVSPDHPWVTEHPDWFYRRPDGTIKFAENPPKKYEDIYPVNFRSPDWKNLWAALRDVVLLWAERGVRIFRVDNPHTKPLAFWEWLIREVQDRFPDAIFLAEAFTRPKMMKVLGKAGFTQSYTYFTWRNSRWELTEYVSELTQTPMREYYRANFFVNTPDILPRILQEGGRPAFRMRLVLAATLSTTYGIYSGYELCENTPRGANSEYYLDSEMYQHKVWDWERPGNIVEDVRRVNRIRRDNPALHLYDNVRFHGSDNDQVICYSKETPDRRNVIVVTVNVDPFNVQSAWVTLPLHDWGMAPHEPYVVRDLMGDASYVWNGATNWVRLDPFVQPAHIFRVELPRR